MSSAKELWDPLDAYIFAQHAHENIGTYFPTPKELKDTPDPPNTIAGVKQRIIDLQQNLDLDLERLLEAQADRYYEDALDRYVSYDPTQFPSSDDPEDWPTELKNDKTTVMYHQSRLHDTDLPARFRAESNALMQSYARALPSHLTRLRNLKEEDRKVRKQLEARFPQSISEFRAIPDATKKIRVARFLSLKSVEQREKMMDESQWAWAQVEPLINSFKSDGEFQKEIESLIKSVEVTDPRRRLAS